MKKIAQIILLLSFVGFSFSVLSQRNRPNIRRCKNMNMERIMNPFVSEDTIRVLHDTNDVSLIVYKPFYLSWHLAKERPDINDTDIFFCAPAAFTAKNYKDIVGNFVCDGDTVINSTEQENGFCYISGNKVVIKSLNDSSEYYFNKAIANKASYFQQVLLILDSTRLDCNIFGKQKPTFRRAIAIKNGVPMVVESLNRMNVNDFSDVMIEKGFQYAIYMDMGTWSEGYYRTKDKSKVTIGRLKQNTNSQSNWLVFRKQIKKQ